jgi:hypothetical protein
MYYKNINIPYENIGNCNIITGFPKYYKVETDKFTLIDTYDMISITYYHITNIQKLTPIDKKEWDEISSIINIAYKKRRECFFR